MIEPIELKTYSPTPQQIKFHTAEHRHKLFGGAVGGGKSRTLCEEVNRILLKYPGNRAFMCRKLLADFMMSTYQILMKTIIGQLIELGEAHHDKAKRIITLPNKSQIFYGGLHDSEDSLASDALRRIKSSEFGVIAIDEANEVGEDDFKWADSRLRHRLDNGQFPPFYILLASNPCQNWLKNRFIDNPEPSQDIFIQSLTEDNPYNPPGYAAQLKLTFRSKEWEDVYIRGSWAALREIDQLIPYSALQDCINCIPTRLGLRAGVISIDTALMGDDECVIMYIEQNKLIETRVFPYIENSMAIVGEARQLKDRHSATRYVVDSVGVGDGVAARLEEAEGAGMVKRIVGGAVAEEDFLNYRDPNLMPKFANLKSQIWWYCRDMVLDRAVSFPKDADTMTLIGQLSSMHYKIKSDKSIQVETKELYKKRIGKSPDRADAFVMGLWGLRDAPEKREIYGQDDDEYSWRDQVAHNYGYGARVRR